MLASLLSLLLLPVLAPQDVILNPVEAAAPEAWPETGLPVHDVVCDTILEIAAEENQVMQHLAEMVDGIGPRLTSSPQCQEACEWAAQRFRDFGVPNVRLEPWGEFPVGFERRELSGRVVQPRKMKLELTTRSWTPGTNGPERGPLRRAPADEEAMAAATGTFANTWILLGGGSSPRWDSDGDDFRSALGHFLDEEGIFGTVRVTRGDLVVTSGRYRIENDAIPTRTEILLPRFQGQQLAAWLDEGQEVEVEFDCDQVFHPGPIPQYNVIAEIPGTEMPEELVIFGGHLDSWDGSTGTCDNGTGCATTLEAARLIGEAMRRTGQKPRRTIRFMLWTGEEQGLLGSLAHIKNFPEESERTSAVIVHDGGTNFLSGIAATPLLEPIFEEAFEPIDRMVAEGDEEFSFRIRSTRSLPLGIGSDHDSYLRNGVPGFFWNQSGESNYNYVHHTQHDHFDNAIERYEKYSSKVVALAAWRLANTDQMLPREDILSNNSGGESRRPNRRMLGVYLSDEDGLTVESLVEEGMAAQVGWKAGDKVIQIDGTKLEAQGDLRRALRRGEAVKTIVLKRGDRLLSFRFDWDNNTAKASSP